MTDLSKVDFSKCKLPKWQDEQVIAECYSGLVSPVHIMSQESGVFASRSKDGEWSLIRPFTGLKLSQFDDLRAICAKVDAFIEAELRWIAEEALPPWRECTLEEAALNFETSQWNTLSGLAHNGSWIPMREKPMGNLAASEYRYRTRAPKPEPKMPSVKAPEGLVWALLGSKALPDEKPNWWLVPKSATDSDLERVDTFEVPRTTLQRDAMLACVAAFDHSRDADGYLYDRGHRWLMVEVEG